MCVRQPNRYAATYIGSHEWECGCGAINEIDWPRCDECKRDQDGELPDDGDDYEQAA